ncbi:MAG: tRNA 2-thiouridine(34) synthase MnmA [Flavobacteriaceae bacterium]|nr:tRNA 2-thiouridine(34) synthase MnmA [Flavobacteriaceae bacterium]
MKGKRVIVGLSGGVDSSVAACLLKEQGYEVIGLFMKNWHDESVTLSAECPWLEDSNDAMLVAQKLGIAFQTVDLSKEYKERIVDYMFAEYERGRTPNPDVLCNREIKFDVFLKIALSLGADYVATGHYCQKASTTREKGSVRYHLQSGADANKDQSYFLCQLNQEQLGRTLFPIGHLEKSEVRRIAKSQDLITAEKKDSQGLCFIGKVSLPDFLQQQLQPKTGPIIEIPEGFSSYEAVPTNFDSEEARWAFLSKRRNYQTDNGVVVGEHQGAHYFTVGQRKGLAVGGTPDPLFVLAVDTETNTLFVGQGKDHPGLFQQALHIQNSEVHWVNPDHQLEVGASAEYEVRIRYRQPLQKATLHTTAKGMYIVFEEPQSAITPGQFAAWYREGELIGSGVIA